MVQWLGWASQGYEMFCREPETKGSNLSWVNLGVHSLFVLVGLWTQNNLLLTWLFQLPFPYFLTVQEYVTA